MNRRTFLQNLGAASALAYLPFHVRELFAASEGSDDLVISEVEILRVTGTREILSGVNRQHQVQPIHIYDDHRPREYRDSENPTRREGTVTHNYLRIRTKGGLEGLYGYVDREAIPTILGSLRSLLFGQDALAVEKLWDLMYRSNRHSRASHYMMGISYLDNALWDLRGRLFECPVYRLLGGPTRNPARVYGSCLGFAIEPGLAGKRAAELKRAGFTQQKWFLAYGPANGADGMNRNVELVAALRDSVGDEVQLMFDAFMGWDLQYALEWARKVERYRPYWIEEAFPVADLESFIRLSRGTSIPVATGEHFYNRWEVEQYLKADAIQVVQADPEWCGGVSELVKICHLASVHGAKVIPHGHNIHAALHVVASQSPVVCPFGEYLINYVPDKLHFQKNPLLTSNGLIALPNKPGFGIELDDSKISERTVSTRV